MSYDAHKNFAYSLVATAPSPASSGTSLVVTGGQGTLFPAVPFNATVWPANANPITTNAEIVRVTGISTDTLTITRAQESSSARSIIVGDQIAATITAKTLTDVETVLYNPYRFLVYRSAAYTTSGTTVIPFDTKVYDTGTNIDVTTNKGRFTAPAAGFYKFEGMLRLNLPSSGGIALGCGLYKNGSAYINSDVWVDNYAGSYSEAAIGLFPPIQLAANDYIELYETESANIALNVGGPPYLTWFSGALESLT